eukprot:TRINITY_DN20123_c0_g1_i2.p1 TRINITY_DN20123_c0_g1~~TRINITY_DN20123_c0_g1_i2.p1  ORF type:complete len:420 (+),score=59.19 TRINITY_DN20123_c0_g1_i2:214-1473(+)
MKFRWRFQDVSLLVLISSVCAERPAREGVLATDSKAEVELKIIAFSDVHGRVLESADPTWSESDLERPKPMHGNTEGKANRNLHDLMKSKIVERTIEAENPDLLIFGGDMTTMIGDDLYEVTHGLKDHRQEGCNRLGKACVCTENNVNEIASFFQWFASLGPPTLQKIVVAGNHDVCFDFSLVTGYGEGEFWMQLPNFVSDIEEVRQEFMDRMKMVKYLKNEYYMWKPSKGEEQGISIPILGSPLSSSREYTNRGAFQYYPSSGGDPEGVIETGISDLRTAVDALEAEKVKPIVVIHGPPDNVNSNFPTTTQYVFDIVMKASPVLVFAGHFHASENPTFRYLHNPAYMKEGVDGKPHAEKLSAASAGGVPLYMTPLKQQRPEVPELDGRFVRAPVVCTCTASQMSDLNCAVCSVPDEPA